MDEASIEQFMGQMFGHMTGATTVACVLLAAELDLYGAAADGPTTAAALAAEEVDPKRALKWAAHTFSTWDVAWRMVLARMAGTACRARVGIACN